MSATFILLTLLFVVVSVVMVLIILVQRPQGGGLAGAFGGAGGGGTESVFGGRVGDALTWATVVAFVLYLSVAITLNLIADRPGALSSTPTPIDLTPAEQPAGAATEGATIRRLDGPPPGLELPPEFAPKAPPGGGE